MITFALESVDPAPPVADPEIAPFFVVNSSTAAVTLTQSGADWINYECRRLQYLEGCPEKHRAYTLHLTAQDNGEGELITFFSIVVNITNKQERPQLPSRLHMEIREDAPPNGLVVSYPRISSPLSSVDVPDFYDDDKLPLQFTVLVAADNSPFSSVIATATNATVSTSTDGSEQDETNPAWNINPPYQFPQLNFYQYSLQLPLSLYGPLDYETQSYYNLTLRVQDGTFTDDIPLRLDVVDVLEAPFVTTQAFSGNRVDVLPFLNTDKVFHFRVQENIDGGFHVGQVFGWDPDGDELRFRITRVQKFRFDGQSTEESADSQTDLFHQTFVLDEKSGELTVQFPSQGQSSVLDFESYESYNVTVQISDKSPGDISVLSVDCMLVIQVEDVNDLVISRIQGPTTLATEVRYLVWHDTFIRSCRLCLLLLVVSTARPHTHHVLFWLCYRARKRLRYTVKTWGRCGAGPPWRSMSTTRAPVRRAAPMARAPRVHTVLLHVSLSHPEP